MTPWQEQLVARLPEPLRRDAKKTAILGGLLLSLAGVMYVQFGRGDGTAEASVAPEPAAAAAPAYALTPVPAPRSASKAQPSPGSRVARWLETPPPALDRNVFLMRVENFQTVPPPAQAAAPATAVRVVEEDLFWDELAKSMGARADQRRQRQIWIDNLAAAAGRIRVQTTIMGHAPVAMINGRRAGIGDTVEAAIGTGGQSTVAFRLVAIEPRRIVVERDGMKFEVTMTGAARAIPGTD
jgi:hypothetical protein